MVVLVHGQTTASSYPTTVALAGWNGESSRASGRLLKSELAQLVPAVCYPCHMQHLHFMLLQCHTTHINLEIRWTRNTWPAWKCYCMKCKTEQKPATAFHAAVIARQIMSVIFKCGVFSRLPEYWNTFAVLPVSKESVSDCTYNKVAAGHKGFKEALQFRKVCCAFISGTLEVVAEILFLFYLFTLAATSREQNMVRFIPGLMERAQWMDCVENWQL